MNSASTSVGEAPHHHVLLVPVPPGDATSAPQPRAGSGCFELNACRVAACEPAAATAVLDLTVGGRIAGAGMCAADVDRMDSGPLVVDGVDRSLTRPQSAAVAVDPLATLFERTVRDVGTAIASAAIVVVSPLRGTPATFSPGRAPHEADLVPLWSPFTAHAPPRTTTAGATSPLPSAATKLVLMLHAAWARRGLGTRCSLVGWDAWGRTHDLLAERFPSPRHGSGDGTTAAEEEFADGGYGPDGRAPPYADPTTAATADEFPTIRAFHLVDRASQHHGAAPRGELNSLDATERLRPADAVRLLEAARAHFVQGAQRIAQTAGAAAADTRWALGLRIDATRPDGVHCGDGSVWLFEVTPGALTMPLDTRRHGVVAPSLVSTLLAATAVPTGSAAPLLSAAAVPDRPDLSLALAIVGGAQCTRRVTLVPVVPSGPIPAGSEMARAAWRALAGCATLRRRTATCPVLPAPARGRVSGGASGLSHLYVAAVDELRDLRARLRAHATGIGDQAAGYVQGEARTPQDASRVLANAVVGPAAAAANHGGSRVVLQVDPICLFPFRAWSLALRQRLAVLEDEEAQLELRARMLDRYHRWLLSTAGATDSATTGGQSHRAAAQITSAATAAAVGAKGAIGFGSGSLAAAAQHQHAASQSMQLAATGTYSGSAPHPNAAALEALAAQEHAELTRLRRWLSADTERLSAELRFLSATAPAATGRGVEWPAGGGPTSRRGYVSRAGSPTTAGATAGTLAFRESSSASAAAPASGNLHETRRSMSPSTRPAGPPGGDEGHNVVACSNNDPLVAAFAALEDDFAALTDETFSFAVKPTATRTVTTERQRLARLALRRFVADVEGIITGAPFSAWAPSASGDADVRGGDPHDGGSALASDDSAAGAIARTHAALVARRNGRQAPLAPALGGPGTDVGTGAGALQLISVAATMRRCADLVVTCAGTAATALRRSNVGRVEMPDAPLESGGPSMSLATALTAAGARRIPSPGRRGQAGALSATAAAFVDPRRMSPPRGGVIATDATAGMKPKRRDLFDAAGIDTAADRMTASRATAAALVHVEWLSASAAALSATAAGAVAAATDTFRDTMGVQRDDCLAPRFAAPLADGAATGEAVTLGAEAARADAFSREVALLCAGHSLRRRQVLSGGELTQNLRGPSGMVEPTGLTTSSADVATAAASGQFHDYDLQGIIAPASSSARGDTLARPSHAVKSISVDPFSGAVRSETDRGAVLSVQLGRVLHTPDTRSGRFEGVRPSAVAAPRHPGAAAAHVPGRDAVVGVRRGLFSQQQTAGTMGGRARTPAGPRVGR